MAVIQCLRSKAAIPVDLLRTLHWRGIVAQMTSGYAIVVFASTLFLMACSAEPAPLVAHERADEAKASEAITTISLALPQWRKDPDCFEPDAKVVDFRFGYYDVERTKWRNPRTFRGYFYTHFEGASFVSAQRTELPDEVGEGRYQTDLYSTTPYIAGSAEPQTYWIEFIGREALCNSQSPDDASFDLPFSPNLVRVDKVIRQTRVR